MFLRRIEAPVRTRPGLFEPGPGEYADPLSC